ncbi:MAG: pilus assembly protein CpaE, partial [Caulobacteraceae bacterium]|nr:pilus assembly protein CpaE [Caulobacteraceae bacterium]
MAVAGASRATAGHGRQIDPVPRVSIQVFCESPEVAELVSRAVADRRMAKAHVKQNMGGAAAAVEAYRSAPTPNVIVLEAPSSRETLIAQLEELANFCDAGTKVVILGRTNDIVLYRELIARGVSEYLVAPFAVVDFVHAVSNLFRAPGAKPLGRIISVVG